MQGNIHLEFQTPKSNLSTLRVRRGVRFVAAAAAEAASGRLTLDDVHQPTAHRQPKHLVLATASIHRTSISGCSSFRQPLSIICGLHCLTVSVSKLVVLCRIVRTSVLSEEARQLIDISGGGGLVLLLVFRWVCIFPFIDLS